MQLHPIWREGTPGKQDIELWWLCARAPGSGYDAEAWIGFGPLAQIARGERDDRGAEGACFADRGGRAFFERGRYQHVCRGDECERHGALDLSDEARFWKTLL